MIKEKVIIPRDLIEQIKKYALCSPCVIVGGPRQAGKSTAVKMAFPDYEYINLDATLDDGITKIWDESNIGGAIFACENKKGVIIDEAQNIPGIFNQLYTLIEKQRDRMGHFIVTCSQNYLMMKHITQSLAGRVTLLDMLPLSYSELSEVFIQPTNVYEYMFKGSFPRIYTSPKDVIKFYNDYIKTYIERDVSLLDQIHNKDIFINFMKAYAVHSGSIVNDDNLASTLRMTVKEIQNWTTILARSYLIKTLNLPIKNLMRNLASKKNKMHFMDSGLLCRLLEIKTLQEIKNHEFKGHIFETMIMSELYKEEINVGGYMESYYFWRHSEKYEVDCIVPHHNVIIPI
jgi:predicted AAA+ superfamily ATPase